MAVPETDTSARRERARKSARDAIIEAATEVFARRGPDGATLDEIARAAGYTAPALYRYFPNKQALYVAVVDTIEAGFGAILDEAPPIPLAFDDRLRWLLSRLFRNAEDQRAQFVALMAHRVHQDRALQAEVGERERQRHTRFSSRFAAIIQDAIEAGELRDDLPASDLATALNGMLNGVVLRWLHQPDPEPLVAMVEPLVTLFLGGARRPRTEEDRT